MQRLVGVQSNMYIMQKMFSMLVFLQTMHFAYTFYSILEYMLVILSEVRQDSRGGRRGRGDTPLFGRYLLFRFSKTGSTEQILFLKNYGHGEIL